MNYVINLDKPRGITSQEAVASVKKILHQRKAGHAGTLDPIATGVLLICLNEATKITRFLMDLKKEYIVRIKLGERTDTLDAEGAVIEKVEGFYFDKEDIVPVLRRFQGEIEQVPPMFSAIKIKGRPLYELARRGIIVERQKRHVLIHRIDLLYLDLPFMDLRVACSKGTYIRSLCSDIGDALGVGGHITELRRIATGSFRIEDSITIDELLALIDKESSNRISLAGKLSDQKKQNPIMTIDKALKDLEEVSLNRDDVRRAKNGVSLKWQDSCSLTGYIKLKDHYGRLFGIGRVENGLIKIERILKL